MSRQERIEVYLLEGSPEYLAGRIVDLEDELVTFKRALDPEEVRRVLQKATRAREPWLVEFLAREDRIARGGLPWRL